MEKINLFNINSRPAAQNQRVQYGLLFIPDISGFTEFVHSTDVLTGKKIIHELLSTIIRQDRLRLTVAEIEGDAVLFYRYGAAPAVSELLRQYERMKTAFDKKREELQIHFSQPIDLSLKVIAHYGTMAEFRIGQFRKLYGEVVIEAHRLLKNAVASDNYLLLTDALLEKAAAGFETVQQRIRSAKLCEIYGALRNICFTYFDFSGEKGLTPPAAFRPSPSNTTQPPVSQSEYTPALPGYKN